jgi:pimeloyl-ACP methyl ester carboxylesterase
VQPEVAETTQVCAYDRAGRGWSEADPEPVSLARTSRNLHTLLANAGVAGPYVLVGHSIGGVYVRQFAADYPDEVAGLVLLDSSHPDQYQRYPEMRAATENSLRLTALFPALARLGLFRLYFANGGEIDFQDLPPAAHAQVAAFWSSPALFASQHVEGRAAQAVLTDAQALGSLDNLPLAVISASSQLADGWDTLQAELATLSTNSNHLTVEGANHVSLVFNPEHAAEVSAAILELVSDAQ